MKTRSSRAARAGARLAARPVAAGKHPASAVRHPARRRLVGLAAAVALMLSLSACGDDYIGSAAQVGDTSLGESALVAATDAQLDGVSDPTTGAAPSTAQRSLVNRQILTNQIRHELLTEIAAGAGVSVSEAEIKEATGGDPAQAAQALGVPAEEVPEAVRDFLTVTKIAQQDAEAGETVPSVVIQAKLITTYTDRATAVADREKFLADPAAMDAAMAAAGQGAGKQTFDLVKMPAVGIFGIYAAEPGDIVLVNQGEQVLLVQVVTREETESDQLAASMGTQQSIQGRIGVAWLALAKRAKDIDVSVNPRFGVWDPVSMMVAPTSAGL